MDALDDRLPSLQDLVPVDRLSLHAQALIAHASPHVKTTTIAKREIVNQFHSVFEMIGGVPRLALWADANPGDFYAMYSKLLPSAAKLEVTLVTPDNLKQVPTDQLKGLVLKLVAKQAPVQDADLVEGTNGLAA